MTSHDVISLGSLQGEKIVNAYKASLKVKVFHTRMYDAVRIIDTFIDYDSVMKIGVDSRANALKVKMNVIQPSWPPGTTIES